MRRFTSYGPVESAAHFAVERRELVNQCVEQLVGTPEERGGHYFTIWGPRQTGKTWVMRQAIKAIRERYGDEFIVGTMNLQSVADGNDTKRPIATFLIEVPILIQEAFGIEVPETKTW